MKSFSFRILKAWPLVFWLPNYCWEALIHFLKKKFTLEWVKFFVHKFYLSTASLRNFNAFCFLFFSVCLFFSFLLWELVGSFLEVPRPLNCLDDMLWCRSSLTHCAVFLVGNFSLEIVVLGIFLKLFCRWFHPLYFYSSFLQGFLLLSCWVSCGCPLIFFIFCFLSSHCLLFYFLGYFLKFTF